MPLADQTADPIHAGDSSRRLTVAPDFRVLGALAALLVLVAIGIGIAVWLILDIRHATVDLTEREVEYAAAVGDIALISKTLANDERGYLITGADEFLRQWDGRTAQVHEAFSRAYANASEEQWLAVDRARKSFNEWHAATEGVFAAYKSGARDEAIAASLDHNRVLRKAYEAQLSGTQSLADFAIESASEEVTAHLSRSVAILIGYLVVALVVGVLIAAWMVRQIVRPVHDLLAVLTSAENAADRRLRNIPEARRAP